MTNELEMLDGVVLGGAHGIYDVYTDNGTMRCILRGKLRKAFARAQAQLAKPQPKFSERRARALNDPDFARRSERIEKHDSSQITLPTRLSAGDHVKVRCMLDGTGVIEEILPRQSELARKDAGSTERKVMQQTLLANLNQVAIVLAMAQPEPHFSFLDRYLAICEAASLHVLICMNKADLPHATEVDEMIVLYERLGYCVLRTSAQTMQGIEELRALLKDHTTLFTGPSGVGKSSLVNAVEPGMALRTGLISDVTGKGRHTTTSSRLYPLSEGGWLADSAGIRALATWNIEPEELAQCFVEFRPYLGQCEYSDCSHIDEEGCAILQALQEGVIDERRHRSYVRMYLNEER